MKSLVQEEERIKKLIMFAIDYTNLKPSSQEEWRKYGKKLHRVAAGVLTIISQEEDILKFIEKELFYFHENPKTMNELKLFISKVHEYDTAISKYCKRIYNNTRSRALYADNWLELWTLVNRFLKEIAKLDAEEEALVLEERKKLIYILEGKYGELRLILEALA